MAQVDGKPFEFEDKSQQRRDLVAELSQLEEMISDLKVQYEQFFSGILALAPEKAHADVKRTIRGLMQAPFRNSALNYRLRALRNRYNSLDTYWQRVLKQREEGTYSKDVFKANLRERNAFEEARAETKAGKAEKGMSALFDSYCSALEKNGGRKPGVNFEDFQKSLINRARDFKARHAGKKLAFKVVVKDGKVTVQARVKE